MLPQKVEATRMFGLLKLLFYTFVAVVVGVFVGTVPVGGKTIGARIAGAYGEMPQVPWTAEKPKPAAVKPARAPAARAAPRPAKAAAVAAPAPAPVVSAGAANAPEAHDDQARAEIEKIIAERARR